jgi:hypothetical protein
MLGLDAQMLSAGLKGHVFRILLCRNLRGESQPATCGKPYQTCEKE